MYEIDSSITFRSLLSTDKTNNLFHFYRSGVMFPQSFLGPWLHCWTKSFCSSSLIVMTRFQVKFENVQHITRIKCAVLKQSNIQH